MTEETIEIIVPEENHLERIDKFLVYSLEMDLSRSYIQKLIKDGNILVNGAATKQNYKVKTDDALSIFFPEPEELEIEPQDIPLTIVYEDSSIAVINKQPGLVVHPGHGNWDRTLVNALLFHLSGLSSIGGVSRPGIVHRLDKDTSGLMVIAKNDVSHRDLIGQFSGREVKKKYAAIVVGKPHRDHDVIDLPIARHRLYRHKMTVSEGGREARTEYHLKKIWNTGADIFSFLDIDLHTGRTHQIRVHLSSTGNPIVGDAVYSKKWEKHRVPYLLLASVSLGFRHPESGENMSFQAPLPDHMAAFIERCEKFDISNR